MQYCSNCETEISEYTASVNQGLCNKCRWKGSKCINCGDSADNQCYNCEKPICYKHTEIYRTRYGNQNVCPNCYAKLKIRDRKMTRCVGVLCILLTLYFIVKMIVYLLD